MHPQKYQFCTAIKKQDLIQNGGRYRTVGKKNLDQNFSLYKMQKRKERQREKRFKQKMYEAYHYYLSRIVSADFNSR